MRRGTSARTSSTSSSSFFRIKNSYRKPRNSTRTSSTGSSSVASSSDFDDDFEPEDVDEDEDDDDAIELEHFGNMYINEEQQNELFDEAVLKQILNKTAPVRITLKLQVTESTFSVWETVSGRE